MVLTDGATGSVTDVSRGTLDRDQWNRRIEPSDVVGIRRDDAVAPRACTQHHGRSNDIGRSSDATELPGFACSLVVERNDLGVRCAEQSCEPGLSPPVAPHLADDTPRHGQSVPVLNVSKEERDDSALVPLECDERAGIECEPWHSGLLRRGRCPPARPPRARFHTKRSIGGATFLGSQRSAGLLQHLLE